MTTWSAPYPVALGALVESFAYKPGWRAKLYDGERADGVSGLWLLLGCETTCAYTGAPMTVGFPFPVPPVVMTATGWREWLWQRVLDAERHEAGEWFQIGSRRPYAPAHVPEAEGYGR